jgi:hypothetical protein
VLHLKLPGAAGGVIGDEARPLLCSHLFQLAGEPAGGGKRWRGQWGAPGVRGQAAWH